MSVFGGVGIVKGFVRSEGTVEVGALITSYLRDMVDWLGVGGVVSGGCLVNEAFNYDCDLNFPVITLYRVHEDSLHVAKQACYAVKSR